MQLNSSLTGNCCLLDNVNFFIITNCVRVHVYMHTALFLIPAQLTFLRSCEWPGQLASTQHLLLELNP